MSKIGHQRGVCKRGMRLSKFFCPQLETNQFVTPKQHFHCADHHKLIKLGLALFKIELINTSSSKSRVLSV
jgi:hypothetical protein